MTCFGIFIPSSPAMHVEALEAFAEGLASRGIKYRKLRLEDGYRKCDIAVTFGVGKEITERGRRVGSVLEAHRLRKGTGKNIVVERGFIERHRYFMVGWSGLNGRADYRNRNSPSDRWQALKTAVAPWRTDGEHVLLCGQVPWDASVQHTDHVTWCRETAQAILDITNRPVRFRPHPAQPAAVDMADLEVELSNANSLQDDMKNAWAVVTFNSNAGVEATLAGVPAFVADSGAMGYSILNRSLEALCEPAMPERTQWLHDLAYTQWTLNELSRGIPQEHLWYHDRTWTDKLCWRFLRKQAA